MPKKTEQEEISDILNQMTDECKLDDDINDHSESSSKVIVIDLLNIH